MGDTNIIVDVSFLQYGMHAPSNSAFTGILTTGSLFGGFFDYTGRDDAVKGKKQTCKNDDSADCTNTKNSDQSGSFLDYTSRDFAISGSSEKQYFTMSSEGKLYTTEAREQFRNKWSRSFSKKGDLAWTVVVSLNNYSLLAEYGIHDQTDFAQITTVVLNKAFQKMKLNPLNMIWWEDYHTNTAHPHIHVTFLEKENTRSRGKLTAKEVKLLKSTFITEIAARRTYFQKYNENSEDALKNLQIMKNEIVSKSRDIPFQTVDAIMNLYTQLPAHGRLQYNSSHMIPYRKQLDEIVELLLKHETVKEEYMGFISEINKLTENVNGLGKADIFSLRESQERKLRIQIANTVLQEFKHYSENRNIRRVREWKRDKGNELIRSQYSTEDDSESIELQLKTDSVPEINDFFLKGASMITDPMGNDQAEGFMLIHEAAEHGDVRAKKYINFMKKSYGMNKVSYHSAQHDLSNRLIPLITKDIREKKNEVDDEINDYLYGNSMYVSDDSENNFSMESSKVG